MKTLALPVLAVALAACGSDSGLDDVAATTASIRLATEVETNTRTIGIRVFASRDTSDVIVTCTSLLSGNVLDARYDLLASGDFDYPLADGQSLTVGDIVTDGDAVVYVNARDSRDAVIGEGCTANIEVNGGGTTDVSVVVYEAS